MDDEIKAPELIALLRQGNQESWHYLVSTWLPRIKAATTPYNLPEDDRNEVVQRVFIDFHNSINKFEPTNIESYLVRSVRWRAIDLIRERARRSEGPLDRDFTEADSERDFDEDSKEMELLREALRTLPRRERLVIFLFYYNQCSYARIAEMMNADYDWVKNTLHRTKSKLKRMTHREDD